MDETEHAPNDVQAGIDVPEAKIRDALGTLFAEALDRESVASDDDFFRLGGQSLLAMRLIWRVRETFGVELRVKALFDHPTPRALATAIAEARPPARVAHEIPPPR